MTRNKQTRAQAANGRAGPSAPSRRRYNPDALTTVLTMLGTFSADAATLFAAIVAVRGDRRGKGENTLDLAALAAVMDICRDGDEPKDDREHDLINCADRLADAVSMNVLDPRWRRRVLEKRSTKALSEQRQPSSEWFAENPDADTMASDVGTVMLSAELVELLDKPLPQASQSALLPRLNAAGRWDIAMVEAIMASGDGGHVALRRRTEAPRDTGDLAAILGTGERRLVVFDGHKKESVGAILRAELHAGAAPPLVLIERDLLTEGKAPDDDEWDEPVKPNSSDPLSVLAATIPTRLVGARGFYLWSVPETYPLSSATLPWIGACIGPMVFDSRWSRTIISDHLGMDITGPAISSGITALARRVADPRDVAAMAATARAIAASGSGSLDAACLRVAASFIVDRGGDTQDGAPFDERLLVCDMEALQLLARAQEAAVSGVRAVAYGPPGGGKSSYIRELGRRMAGGNDRMAGGGRPVRTVGPADFLGRAWGKTERLVKSLWRRAAEDGAILVVDEFEVVGGRRIHGDMSNNALLIRSLTDAWLLALDEFSGVPLLATTNDVGSLDPAILRRFAFVQPFGDRLSPDQERLAWSIILEEDPPSGWRPIGASVADVVLAKQRCRMLGTLDPVALSASVQSALAARTTATGGQVSGNAARKRLH